MAIADSSGLFKVYFLGSSAVAICVSLGVLFVYVVEPIPVAIGSSDEIPEWEQELQKELQEYEVVNEGGDIDDLEIENEILKQIEQDADQS